MWKNSMGGPKATTSSSKDVTGSFLGLVDTGSDFGAESPKSRLSAQL